jgi:hypothetical protein
MDNLKLLQFGQLLQGQMEGDLEKKIPLEASDMQF